MANQVFFTAHPELNQIGACAAIKGNVAVFVINEEDRERFNSIPADEEIIIIAYGLRDALEADELVSHSGSRAGTYQRRASEKGPRGAMRRYRGQHGI